MKKIPVEAHATKFRRCMANWWRKNKRDFPWRQTSDVYKLLISELLLHRTRAQQVVPAYIEFVRRFPTVRDLSNAPENTIESILRTLGLNWRTELLRKMAKEILSEFGGVIPQERADLLSLSGVGPYVASTVRCFVYGLPEVILDTNTVRVIGRLYDVRVIDGSRRNRSFRERYEKLLDTQNPREFNYSMIDLGALVCTPSHPKCPRCPVSSMCLYAKKTKNTK